MRAAIVSTWSNGQTEGQITRLKLVKRQMYGRGKIDLLQARLIGAHMTENVSEDCVRPNIGRRSGGNIACRLTSKIFDFCVWVQDESRDENGHPQIAVGLTNADIERFRE